MTQEAKEATNATEKVPAQVKVDRERPKDFLAEAELKSLKSMTPDERSHEAAAARKRAEEILEQCTVEDELSPDGYKIDLHKNGHDQYEEFNKLQAVMSHAAYMNGIYNKNRQIEMSVRQHIPGGFGTENLATYKRENKSIDGMLGFLEQHVKDFPKPKDAHDSAYRTLLNNTSELSFEQEGLNFGTLQEMVRQASGFYEALNITGRGSTGPDSAPFSQPAGGTDTTEQPGIDVDRPRLNIPVQEVLKLRDMLVTRIQVYQCPPNTDTYKYLKEDPGSDHGGAEEFPTEPGIAEGAIYQPQDVRAIDAEVTVKKIGVISSITRELLSDVVQARAFWNRSLLRRFMEYKEGQCLNGDGSSNSMTGWLNQSGKLEYDRGTDDNFPNVLLDYLLAYVRFTRARNDAAGAGANKEPDLLVMKPGEKGRLMSAVDTDQRFLWGDPHAAGFMNVWGIPIITSDHVAANTAIMLASEDLGIIVKDGIDVEYGLKQADWEHDRRSMKISFRGNCINFRDKSIMKINHLERPYDKTGTPPAIPS